MLSEDSSSEWALKNCVAENDLLNSDICFANDPTEIFILGANVSGEIRAACPDRIEPLDDEARLNLGDSHRFYEPAFKLRHHVLWRFRGSKGAKPSVNLEVLVARFSNGRHLRQRHGSRP